jgi:hypothetical protein
MQSKANDSPLNQELQRLSTQGVMVAPKTAKSIKIAGQTVQLSSQQQMQRQKDIGPLVQKMLAWEIQQGSEQGYDAGECAV